MSVRMGEDWKSAGKPAEGGEEDRPRGVRPWQSKEVIDMMRVSPLMIHLALVLILGWIASLNNWDLRFVFALGFAYIFCIESRQRWKIETRIRSEERRFTDRKRLMSDAETARWLNTVVKSMWPVFLQQFASEHFLMTIAPWFLEQYKPWTAKKIVIQKLYLGKTPPKFTFVRAGHRDPSKGYDTVLEMTINFEASKDMHGVMAVQVRKRLGFGFRTSIHISDLQMEGNVRLGLKFVNGWPGVKFLRISFTEAPIIRLVAKPVFSSGVDVADLPLVESYLHKMINDAMQNSLVEPNQLTVDVEKLVGELMATYAGDKPSGKKQTPGSMPAFDSSNAKMFKGSIATLLVEILQAEKLKSADSNGKSDPYVKITAGKTLFTTSIKERTLQPEWYEQFNLPVMDWDSPLKLRVRDKDRFFDDELGFKQITLSEDIRDGRRHEMWVQLDGVKTGRLQIALTVKETPIVDPTEASFDRVDDVQGEDSAGSQISDIESREAAACHGMPVYASSSGRNSWESQGSAREHGGGNGDHAGIKGSIATLLVEILKAENLMAADANGKSDPYVKIASGKMVFTTTIKKKTLQPEWFEQFHVPVINWDSRLKLRVRDKDMFFDDEIGFKDVILSEEIRDGQRHEMWVQLDGVKTGRLQIALTVQDLPILNTSEGIRDNVDNPKGDDFGMGPSSSTKSPVLAVQDIPNVDISEGILESGDNLKGEDSGKGPGSSTSYPAGSQRDAGSQGFDNLKGKDSGKGPGSSTSSLADSQRDAGSQRIDNLKGRDFGKGSGSSRLFPARSQRDAGSRREDIKPVEEAASPGMQANKSSSAPNSQAGIQVDRSASVHQSQSSRMQVDGSPSMRNSQAGMQADGSSSARNSQAGMQVDGSSSVPNSGELHGENGDGNWDDGAEELSSPSRSSKERSRMRRMGRGVMKRMEKTAQNINNVFHGSPSR